ncbi:hypothetical protein TNCV_1742741 [Trichonephila clavipes]|nr:hypothetical protein TNCV_1742741 [Trichonephila clavipes]
MSRLKRFPVCVAWKLGEGVPVQVSSSSFDHSSEERECLEKKELSLQEVLDFLLNLPSESSDARTENSSDEGVPADNLLKFSSDSEEKDQETEQDPECSSSCSENTIFPTPVCVGHQSRVVMVASSWLVLSNPNATEVPPCRGVKLVDAQSFLGGVKARRGETNSGAILGTCP